MDLRFQTEIGQKFNLEVHYFDTIFEIKKKINRHFGITLEKQILIFDGKELENEGNTSDYNILPNSLINLRIRGEPNAVIRNENADRMPPLEKLILQVRPHNSQNTVCFEVNPKDKVSVLRSNLDSRITQFNLDYTLPDEYAITYRKEPVDETRSFLSYGMRDNTLIEIISTESEEEQDNDAEE